MKPANLLRWYPRAWRERYGAELLALIQDTLDEGQPTWRLRLGVVWGGLRERGHRAGYAVRAAGKWLRRPGPWGTILAAGLTVAGLPDGFLRSPHQPRGWQATAALDAVLAAVALTGALVLASGLVALPALVRFLRAGGWLKIRRRVARASGVTAVAGGGLAALVLVSGPLSFDQLNASAAYNAGYLAAGLAMAASIGLWVATAAATARHLTLAPRVRAAQLMLGAVTPTAVMAVLVALDFWWAATQTAAWLIGAAVLLGAAGVNTRLQLRVAARKRRRLLAGAGGGTAVSPSARRKGARHRA